MGTRSRLVTLIIRFTRALRNNGREDDEAPLLENIVREPNIPAEQNAAEIVDENQNNDGNAAGIVDGNVAGNVAEIGLEIEAGNLGEEANLVEEMPISIHNENVGDGELNQHEFIVNAQLNENVNNIQQPPAAIQQARPHRRSRIPVASPALRLQQNERLNNQVAGNPAVLDVDNPEEMAVGLRQRNSPNRPNRAAARNARDLMSDLRRNNLI